MAKLELKIGDKTYNKAWVDSLSSISQITSDAASINYGVVASTGNATLHDNNGQIRADIENGVLPVSNAPTKVILNDTQVQEHTTIDSDYSIIDKELNLQFSDRLSLLDKVTYGGMPLRDYSMTAYEMLDDVIGSYGEYVKERPINWVKYQNGGQISTTSKSKSITVTTISGWEIIGTPIKVTPFKSCSLAYSISTNTEYTVGSGQGIALQVLESMPTNSNCEDIALTSAALSTTNAENIGTLNFTPTTDTVYLVLNFGYASDEQTVKVTVNSARIGGKSLAIATQGDKYISRGRNGYLNVTTQSIYNFLDSKTLSYPYLPAASYRETIEKFCTFAQITLALDNNGGIYFYDARPCIKNETPQEISKSYQITNLNKTLFLKNKVDGVDIKQNKVKITNESNVSTYSVEYGSEITSLLADDYSVLEGKTGSNRPARICDVEDIKTNVTYNANRYISCCGLSAKWLKHSIIIDKKQDNGLVTINDMNGDSNYTIEFSKKTTPCSMKFDYNTSSTTVYDIVYGTPKIEPVTESGFKNVAVYKKDDLWSAQVVISDKTFISATELYDMTSLEPKSLGKYLIDVEVQAYSKTFYATAAFVDSNWKEVTLNGSIVEYTPKKLSLNINGSKTTVSFEDVNLSSAGIENANNAVSIPTNELMQNDDEVLSIRNNILEDYANGVPTANIDLFYDESNKINKGDIICFNDDLSKYDDMNLWRVTGKTFKYNGYPSLSLEIQKQRDWHITDEWHGSARVDNISNGDFNADTATTKSGTINLPRAFGKDYYFRAVITYVINNTEYGDDINGIGAISDSRLLLGTFSRVHCDLTISDDGTKVYYTAEEVYKEVASIVYKGYVKSINIVAFRYTEFN